MSCSNSFFTYCIPIYYHTTLLSSEESPYQCYHLHRFVQLSLYSASSSLISKLFIDIQIDNLLLFLGQVLGWSLGHWMEDFILRRTFYFFQAPITIWDNCFSVLLALFKNSGLAADVKQIADVRRIIADDHCQWLYVWPYYAFLFCSNKVFQQFAKLSRWMIR